MSDALAGLSPESRHALESYAAVTGDVPAFARAWLLGWTRRDVELILSACTHDVTWHDPGLAEPAIGIEAVRAFVVDTFRMFPDIETTPDGPPCFSPDRSRIAQPWRMRGTWLGRIDPPGFAPNGRSFDVRGVDLYQLRDGRIARIVGNHNMLEWMEQLGVMPPRNSGALRILAGAQSLWAKLSGIGRRHDR